MPDDAARPTLTIYRRPGCHLCDDAEVLLRDELAIRARAGMPAVSITHVDVSADADLQARYERSIPVFAVGDEEIRLVTSARQIRRFLEHVMPVLL
jgi:hypothetical protein